MARQTLLKLATSDVHAANLIDEGVLKDFTIVFADPGNSGYLAGYYYIIKQDDWFKRDSKDSLDYLNRVRQAVKTNVAEFQRNGPQTDHCVFFRPDENEQRLLYDRYKPS